MTEFYIVRHGKTDANLAGLKQGVINTPNTYLNDLGKAQADKLHRGFDLRGFTQIYSSPLVRTKQTTEILNQTAHLPVTFDPRLLEISYGDWDGQVNAELQQRYPEYFDHTVNDVRPEYVTIAHGESFEQVEARVRTFTKDVAKAQPTGKILIVTHGFTVRSFAINATQSSGLTILEPDNCSVTKILVDPTSGSEHLVYYNRLY
ncbi:MAG: histidine phosphatase family protein [Lactobacillus sp.]|jgi:probable phosphoglycerate mutase|nr:histidine phosphatase family protein [Lactobacillus sp.]